MALGVLVDSIGTRPKSESQDLFLPQAVLSSHSKLNSLFTLQCNILRQTPAYIQLLVSIESGTQRIVTC